MSTNRFSNAAFGAAISLGAALACVAPAHAKVYVGAWDPVYNAAVYPDLGWRGEATFTLPEPCRALSDGWYTNSGTCSGMSISNGHVELYSLAGGTPPLPLTPTLDYTGNPDLTLQMHVMGNELVGVRGFILTPEILPSSVGGVAAGTAFWLGFWGSQNSSTFDARLAACNFTDLFCSLNNPSGDGKAIVTLTPVPEPEAYALALAALGVVGVMRRRRRQ